MRLASSLVGVAGLVLGLAACGGSLTPNADGGGGSGGGSGGTTGAAGTTGTGGSAPCSTLNGCECLAAYDRCAPRTEACWCPTECYPDAPIECVCGGGRFLACQDKNVVAACATELAAVQAKCVGQAFIGDLSALCNAAANPSCVAACLAKLNDTGSCSEIDCSFCQACDCAAPATPSPFAACIRDCSLPGPL